MKEKLMELLKGIGLGVVTMLFMIGMLPWDLVSKLIGCAVAVVVIRRIRKRTNEKLPVGLFTTGYVGVIIVVTILLSLIPAGA